MHPNLTTDLAKQVRRARLQRGVFLSGAALTGILVFALVLPFASQATHSAASSAMLLTATPSPFQPSGTPSATDTPSPAEPPNPAAPQRQGIFSGAVVLSLGEVGHAQLFHRRFAGAPYTRLTSGAWDDIDPAVSPNSHWLAFSSNRGGQWDVYILDLTTGDTSQLSDDAAYDGGPSWSTDGWLAYEHDLDGNLEIAIRPADSSLEPIYISLGDGLDFAPSWRAQTQQIAFVSDRTGHSEVWVINLEMDGAARFTQPSEGEREQNSPAWSPDASQLAWSQLDSDGIWRIYAGAYEGTIVEPRLIGVGEQPVWSPAGDLILATVHDANRTYLTAYTLDGQLALAPEALPGRYEGTTWSLAALPDPLPAQLNAAAIATPNAAWQNADSAASATVSLNDVNAPQALLVASAADSFAALRQRAAQLLGWDALSSLQNAYTSINEPLPPGRQQDWLYTGRALELHSQLIDAGWMAVVREDQAGQTFWRVYLRAAGNLGRPLAQRPWDFSARYTSGDSAYNAGGVAQDAPSGGWLDFTALAADYGFERLPALPNWRSYYHGALFNQFALTAGLSWDQAMLQLYSAEDLATVEAARP